MVIAAAELEQGGGFTIPAVSVSRFSSLDDSFVCFCRMMSMRIKVAAPEGSIVLALSLCNVKQLVRSKGQLPRKLYRY
jgi:hypothetical protein